MEVDRSIVRKEVKIQDGRDGTITTLAHCAGQLPFTSISTGAGDEPTILDVTCAVVIHWYTSEGAIYRVARAMPMIIGLACVAVAEYIAVDLTVIALNLVLSLVLNLVAQRHQCEQIDLKHIASCY